MEGQSWKVGGFWTDQGIMHCDETPNVVTVYREMFNWTPSWASWINIIVHYCLRSILMLYLTIIYYSVTIILVLKSSIDIIHLLPHTDFSHIWVRYRYTQLYRLLFWKQKTNECQQLIFFLLCKCQGIVYKLFVLSGRIFGLHIHYIHYIHVHECVKWSNFVIVQKYNNCKFSFTRTLLTCGVISWTLSHKLHMSP